MCEPGFWRTAPRPASYDEKTPIYERRPLQAKSLEEARRLVEAMPAVVIGGIPRQPALMEGFVPTMATI